MLFEFEEYFVFGEFCFGAIDEEYLLFYIRVGDGEDSTLCDSWDVVVDDTLYLVGTDTEALGFDHIIFARDEIDISLLIFIDEVPTSYDYLISELPLRFDNLVEDGDTLEAFFCLFWGIPVAFVDASSTVDEFTYLSWFACFALFVDDAEIDIWDRFAYRIGADMYLVWFEISRTKRLGESMHRVELGIREVCSDILDHRWCDVAP